MTHRLVFVQDSFAWFCTDPDTAWGDDWNVAPHDCNAGQPYTHRTGGEWVKVAYDGDLEIAGGAGAPHGGYLSVEQINAGASPWLYRVRYGLRCDDEGRISVDCEIRAGVTIEEFTALVEQAGGSVYLKGRE